jgi:hypothetical protein
MERCLQAGSLSPCSHQVMQPTQRFSQKLKRCEFHFCAASGLDRPLDRNPGAGLGTPQSVLFCVIASQTSVCANRLPLRITAYRAAISLKPSGHETRRGMISLRYRSLVTTRRLIAARHARCPIRRGSEFLPRGGLSFRRGRISSRRGYLAMRRGYLAMRHGCLSRRRGYLATRRGCDDDRAF